jgi:hypothetical protein
MQHLYISYPPDDYDFAHRLVDDLQAAGYAVFVDATSEIGTIAWAAETRRAIRTCGAMIMILALAKRRRLGIRHEGVLARRHHKPAYVLIRSSGDLPRYLAKATVVDFSGDYDAALRQLLAALPGADTLHSDPPSPRPRRPRTIRASRRARAIRWIGLIVLLLICLLAGIALGLIPA